MNKKGIFFTFIAIIIMGVFVMIFTPTSQISIEKTTDSFAERISSLDTFVTDVENSYLETVLRASSQKTLLSLILYMNRTDTYLTNLNNSFREVILDGTINGANIDAGQNKIMENNTLTNWTLKIREVGFDTYNVNTSINVTEVRIWQTNPWEIEVSMKVNYSIISEIASWRSNKTIMTTIQIEDMYDPMYLLETNGVYLKTVKRSRVEFNEWNISHVRNHISNGTYVHWEYSSAPSYLMRFTRTIQNSSCCGIHSLISPGNLTPTLSADHAKSYVDYMFWNNSLQGNCPKLYNITNPGFSEGLWDQFRYFKLDLGHLFRYNITLPDYEQGGC